MLLVELVADKGIHSPLLILYHSALLECIFVHYWVTVSTWTCIFLHIFNIIKGQTLLSEKWLHLSCRALKGKVDFEQLHLEFSSKV